MNTENLNADYWDARYQNQQTGWDLGEVSPPLKHYINQLKNKSLRILIPGAGNSYEAEYLSQQGFENITVLDISPTLIQHLKHKHKDNNSQTFLCEDFFEHSGTYDLILEQTFFCAIDRSLRGDYAKKVCELLCPNGKLVGVLFNCEFEAAGPPFGGNIEDYLELFNKYFNHISIQICYNSVAPRMGSEVFVKME
jgi:methyl halide transferase